MSKNTKKEIVNWMKIKWIRVTKDKPNYIFYKNSFTDEHFKEIDIGRKFEKSTKADILLTQKFHDVLPISILKKKDLVKLCEDRVIPVDHHSFYKSLKTVSKPDYIDEDDSESDDS